MSEGSFVQWQSNGSGASHEGMATAALSDGSELALSYFGVGNGSRTVPPASVSAASSTLDRVRGGMREMASRIVRMSNIPRGSR